MQRPASEAFFVGATIIFRAADMSAMKLAASVLVRLVAPLNFDAPDVCDLPYTDEPVLNGVGQPRFNHFPGLYCCSEGGRERLDMFQDSPAAEMFTTTAVCAAFNFQILNPDVV